MNIDLQHIFEDLVPGLCTDFLQLVFTSVNTNVEEKKNSNRDLGFQMLTDTGLLRQLAVKFGLIMCRR